jgi:glutamyl-Q tRNA(Asp) synthetase
MAIVTRFAPSPTGYLHLGHAFSAMFAWRRAREEGGRWLLRLEDIDPVRCRPEFATAILEDLTWLGLNWDGEVRKQSEHMAEYRSVLDALTNRGLLYPCFCTRNDILRSAVAPHEPGRFLIYPGTCRDLSKDECQTRIASGQRYALRLNMQRALERAQHALTFEEEVEGTVACHPEQFGDVVLARKDAPSSYHLCATHDDAVQGVTLVTRGEDLKPATHLHRLLQAMIGWPAPSYAHHKLLTDATGRRLAKRDRPTTLRELRAQGFSPNEIRSVATSTVQ